MYYRGSRVSLSESQPRFYKKPEPRTWRERAREKPKERTFRLSLRLAREDKARAPHAAEGAGFYRPQRWVRPEAAPAGGGAGKAWRVPAGLGRWGGRFVKAALVAGLLGALAWSKVKTTDLLQQVSGLTLARISVEGTHFLTEDQVAQAAHAPLGENMFRLDLSAVSAQVGALSWVKRVFVERRLPKTLLISVVERKPAALVDHGDLYAVDGEGRLLSPSPALSAQDLPVLSGVDFPPEAVGTTQEAQSFKPALDFLAFLRKQDGSMAQDVSEVNLSHPGFLEVTFLDGVTARFDPGVTEGDLRHMALVLADLNAKGKKAASLDFRYKGEVLVRTRQ